MPNVFVPFDTEVYKSINSNHPLLSCLTNDDCAHNKNITFLRSRDVHCRDSDSVFRDCVEFAKNIRTSLAENTSLSDDQREEFIGEFISSRHLISQLRIPSDMMSFHHTAPMHIQQSDWVLHIESISQIFQPFIGQGTPLNPRLRGLHDHPAFWSIRSMLEDSRCKAIFSNIHHTIEQCRTVFKSDIIDRKIHHIPAGPWFSNTQSDIIERGIELRKQRDSVRILFTNSWHGQAPSFILRGGIELVWGFLQIAEACPKLELIIRSAIPDAIAESELGRAMKAHPQIKIIDQKMSDDDIVDLFANTDIFYLNSAALHSVSILRAMHCGHVCLVSDAPGFDEYCEDGRSAMVIRGRRAQVNGTDDQSGWVFDDYSKLMSPQSASYQETSSKVARQLMEVYQSSELRSRFSFAARERVMASNSFEAWKSGFETLLLTDAAEKKLECLSLA